jgi:colanic acid/amylovoran biosynthesis protein
MKILVEPSAHHMMNLGDVAMLTVTVRRLSELWPDASIGVIANDAGRLAAYCPDAVHVPAAGRRAWLDHPLLGATFHRLLPARLRTGLTSAERGLRRRRPRLAARLVRARLRLKDKNVTDFDVFLDWAQSADAVVVVGAGLLTDYFATASLTVLELLDVAADRGAPTAMFGQGVGPLSDPALTAAAGRVLPRLDLVCIREEKAGRPLLRALGVPDDRIETTGDDAIELAYDRRTEAPAGDAIGLNLRLARYSEVGGDAARVVGDVVREAAARHATEPVPLPISSYPNERDRERIAEALALPDGAKGEQPTLEALLDDVRRCRVVVTGSYHAGVFALTQGIPVIGLVNSGYYVGKFEGLADQFGGHCEVVALDESHLRRTLERALDEAWTTAETASPALVAAAARQLERSRAAYRRFKEIVDGR